jgi:hypothetical protein
MNIKRSRSNILDVFGVFKSLRLMKTFNNFRQNNLVSMEEGLGHL